MSLQDSVRIRNAKQAVYETITGTAPSLIIYSGTIPTDCATAVTGSETALVTMTLPSDWLATPASGSVSKSGTWSGTSTAAGTATFFRIVSSDTTVDTQGTAGITGSGMDMILNNDDIAVGQEVTVSSFTRVAAGA